MTGEPLNPAVMNLLDRLDCFSMADWLDPHWVPTIDGHEITSDLRALVLSATPAELDDHVCPDLPDLPGRGGPLVVEDIDDEG